MCYALRHQRTGCSWLKQTKNFGALTIITSNFRHFRLLFYKRQRALISTFLDVLVDDLDVVVAIWPRVFVPEPDHVTQLVHYYPKLVTIFSDRNRLGAPPSAAHIRATSKNIQHIHSSLQKLQQSSFIVDVFSI